MKKNDLKRIQDIKKEIRKKHPGKFTHGKNLRAQEEKNKKRPSKENKTTKTAKTKVAVTKEVLPIKEPENKKESFWRRAGREIFHKTKKALYGVALASSVFFTGSSGTTVAKVFQKSPTETNKKSANQTSQQNNTITMQEALKTHRLPSQADTIRLNDATSMRNEILNLAAEEVMANPAFVDNIVNDKDFIKTISEKPEIIEQLMLKTGSNTLNNFDLSKFEWTAEYLDDMKNDGPMAQTIRDNMDIVDRTAPGKCLGGIKRVLKKIGFSCDAESPYQMPAYMAKSDKFVKLNLNNDFKLLFHVDDLTVVFQNKNIHDPDVIHGHAWLADGKDQPVRRQRCGEREGCPKNFPTNRRRNPYSLYGPEFWAYAYADSHAYGELLSALVENKLYKVEVKDMLVLLAEQDQQTLAILYILHSNLQKEYGLDQIPQEIVTPQSVQAVKDMPQQREYEIKNHGTDEATAAQNVIVSQNNNKQNNVSVNQRASEKKQTLNRLSANRGTKAVKGSEKSPLLKGKLLSKLVKKIRGGDQNPNRLAEVVRQLRRKDRV